MIKKETSILDRRSQLSCITVTWLRWCAILLIWILRIMYKRWMFRHTVRTPPRNYLLSGETSRLGITSILFVTSRTSFESSNGFLWMSGGTVDNMVVVVVEACTVLDFPLLRPVSQSVSLHSVISRSDLFVMLHYVRVWYRVNGEVIFFLSS